MKTINPLATSRDTLFFAQSKFGKHDIRVSLLGVYDGVEQYSGSTSENLRMTGGFGGNLKHTALRCAQIIHDSAFCDSINYIIVTDKIGVADALRHGVAGRWFPASLVNAAA